MRRAIPLFRADWIGPELINKEVHPQCQLQHVCGVRQDARLKRTCNQLSRSSDDGTPFEQIETVMGAHLPSNQFSCEDQLCLQLRRVVCAIEGQSKKRQPGIERVHHLRTEIRRTDVSLQLLTEALPLQDVSQIRRELDRVRKRAGHVRDKDVVRPLLAAASHLLSAEANVWLAHRLDDERKKAARDLRDRCRITLSHDLPQHIQALRHSISRHHRTERTSGAIQKSLRVLISQLFSTARRAHDDVTQLHPLRRHLRNARYAIEAIQWHESPVTARQAATALTSLQTVLGAANDQAELLSFLLDSYRSGANAPQLEPIERLAQRLGREYSETAQSAIYRVCRGIVQLSPTFRLLIQQHLR